MATTITYKGSELASFSNTSKTLRTAGKYLEGDITITAGIDVNNQNKTVIPTEATQSITADTGYTGLGTVTVNGITNTYVGSSVPVNGSSMISGSVSYDASNNRYVQTLTGFEGYYPVAASRSVGGDFDGIKGLPKQSATTIIPSETAQTAVDIHKWTTGTVTVAAITPTYVGSSVPAGSLTVSGPTVTASAGYYSDAATKTISNASLITEKTITAGVMQTSVDNNGLVTTKLNSLSEGFRVSQSNGYIEVTNSTISISIPAKTSTLQLPTQAATTITPSSATQTITGQKYMTGDITVQPIPSQYIVPSGTLTITSVDTTTTFDATSYASVDVNLKNADVTAY